MTGKPDDVLVRHEYIIEKILWVNESGVEVEQMASTRHRVAGLDAVDAASRFVADNGGMMAGSRLEARDTARAVAEYGARFYRLFVVPAR